MIVGVLTICHSQYTWDRSICVFLFNRTTLQVFVTCLTGALYMHPLWFDKHQHDNRVRSELFVKCQRWLFQWQFWFVPSVPGNLREEEEHKPDPWCNPIERNHMGRTRWQLLKPQQSFRITLYLASNTRESWREAFWSLLKYALICMILTKTGMYQCVSVNPSISNFITIKRAEPYKGCGK